MGTMIWIARTLAIAAALTLVAALAAGAGWATAGEDRRPDPPAEAPEVAARRDARIALLDIMIAEARKWTDAHPVRSNEGQEVTQRRGNEQSKILSAEAEISWLRGQLLLETSQASFEASDKRFKTALEATRKFWAEGHKFPFDGPKKDELLKRHQTLLIEKAEAQLDLDKRAAEYARIKQLEDTLATEGSRALCPVGRSVPAKIPKKTPPVEKPADTPRQAPPREEL